MNNLNIDKSNSSIKNSELSSINKQHNRKKLKALDRFEKKHGKSTETLLERADIFKENGEFRKAKHYYIKSLFCSKKLETIHKLMVCMSSLEEKLEATEILEQNLQYFKDSGPYWALYAFYKLEIKEYQEAFGASSLAITKFNQNFPEIWKIFSLSGLISGQHEKSYELSKAYLDAGTENEFIVECFINSCLQLGNFKEGLDFCYSTNFSWEKHPILLGIAANLHGHYDKNPTKQLELNHKACELAPDNVKLQWNLSLAQLRCGKIEAGLNNYEVRFEWDEFPSPRRIFKKAQKWHPDVNPEAQIMIWFEQGIGDQLRFWSALPEFRKKYPNLILEPSIKTEEILQSSFPDLVVRANNINPDDLSSLQEDFDFHLPIGSMYGHEALAFKDKLTNPDFSLGWSFLKPDKLRAMFWKEKLQSLSKKPKIGFCWRSSILSGNRHREYTELLQWEELIKSDKFSFVNLQYDLSHEDFINKYNGLNEYFLNTGHLDQKDDLEGAVALISNLDFVLSAGAAPSMIASACDIPTLIYSTPDMYCYGRIEKFSQNTIFSKTKHYFTNNPSEDEFMVNDVVSYLSKLF